MLTLVLIALMCTADANTRSPENYNGTALGCDFNFCWCFCTQVVTRFLRLLSLWDSVICIREFAWISTGILIISELLIGTDVKWGTIVCLKMSIRYSLWEWSLLYTKIYQLQGITRKLRETQGSKGAGRSKGMTEPRHRQTCSHLGGRNSDAQKFRISEHRRTLTDSHPGGMAACCSHQNKPGSRELYSDVGLRNGRKTIHFREYSSCSKSGFVGK